MNIVVRLIFVPPIRIIFFSPQIQLQKRYILQDSKTIANVEKVYCFARILWILVVKMELKRSTSRSRSSFFEAFLILLFLILVFCDSSFPFPHFFPPLPHLSLPHFSNCFPPKHNESSYFPGGE